MTTGEKIGRWVLWSAAALGLALGLVEAVREARWSAALSPGTPPPAFAAKLPGGEAFALERAKGKVVLLSFWATWCGPCRREMPVLQRLEAEYRSRGVVLLAANVDDPEVRESRAPEWIRELGGEAPLLVYPDAETPRAWHAGTLPTLYVLGRDGAIVAGHSGIASEETLRREIEAALAR